MKGLHKVLMTSLVDRRFTGNPSGNVLDRHSYENKRKPYLIKEMIVSEGYTIKTSNLTFFIGQHYNLVRTQIYVVYCSLCDAWIYFNAHWNCLHGFTFSRSSLSVQFPESNPLSRSDFFFNYTQKKLFGNKGLLNKSCTGRSPKCYRHLYGDNDADHGTFQTSVLSHEFELRYGYYFLRKPSPYREANICLGRLALSHTSSICQTYVHFLLLPSRTAQTRNTPYNYKGNTKVKQTANISLGTERHHILFLACFSFCFGATKYC